MTKIDIFSGFLGAGKTTLIKKLIQEAYAGRDFYDRMVGAVMTNQYFTQPAVDAARKLKILLWDREYIESMMEE